MKICPAGAELTDEQAEGQGDSHRQTDRQTDRTSLIVAFFFISAKAPKRLPQTVCWIICSYPFLSVYFQLHERDEKISPYRSD